MPDCKLLDSCIFFNDQMANMPAVADLMKKRYCKSEFIDCARLRIVEELGRENVPIDLFPNQEDYADQLIAQR